MSNPFNRNNVTVEELLSEILSVLRSDTNRPVIRSQVSQSQRAAGATTSASSELAQTVYVGNSSLIIRTLDDLPVLAAQKGDWFVSLKEDPCYTCYFDRITLANNKYLATLFNGSSSDIVCVRKVIIYNFQETAVTGVLVTGSLLRVSDRTIGTEVTIVSMDSGDTISSNIKADTASTSVTDGAMINRWYATGEELALGASTYQNLLAGGRVVYESVPGAKPLTLREGEGISVKQLTDTTQGTLSIWIMFSVKASTN